MKKQDLTLAKKHLLNEKGLTLSIAKNGEIIFEDSSRGISGFLEAIEKLGNKLEDASVADRVVGEAIALLCVYAKVRSVYAITLSKMAKAVFEKHMIYHEWDNLVENIMDANKADKCPFEKLATEISNSKEAYKRLKALQNSLKHGGHEQFISEENEELKRIRERKLKELKEKRQKMAVEPFHLTDSNFNEIVEQHPIALIDFWASWCGPCLALAPIIDELAREYVGKVFVGKLNVDENPETAERFQIFSIPTILVIKNGREVDRIVGLVPKKQIETALRKHLE
jgi:thioredoxin 1